MSVRTIKAITSKDGATNGKPWTYYDVEFTSGQPAKARTFDGEAQSLKPGEVWDFTLEQTDKGWNIQEWFPSDMEPQGSVLQPETRVQVAPEVWEAKDRRISVLSAYSSAAAFYAEKDATPTDVITLARYIVEDVIGFGEGKPWRKLKGEGNAPTE